MLCVNKQDYYIDLLANTAGYLYALCYDYFQNINNSGTMEHNIDGIYSREDRMAEDPVVNLGCKVCDEENLPTVW